MKKIITIIFVLFILVASTIAYAGDNNIYSDRIGIFQDIKLEKGNTLNGSMVAIFGDIEVDGNLNGEAVSVFGNIIVNGEVSGETVSIFGNQNINGNIGGGTVSIFGTTNMGLNSIIRGDRIQILGGKVQIPSSSVIYGENFDISIFKGSINLNKIITFIFIIALFKAIISFILSFILVASMPERMDKITDGIQDRTIRKLGIGLLVLVINLTATTVLGIILIGIPLIPILWLAMTLLGFSGKTSTRVYIGRKIKGSKKWSITKELVIGSIVYFLLEITIILQPILYVAKIIGMGSTIDTKLGTVKHWSEKEDNERAEMLNELYGKDKQD